MRRERISRWRALWCPSDSRHEGRGGGGVGEIGVCAGPAAGPVVQLAGRPADGERLGALARGATAGDLGAVAVEQRPRDGEVLDVLGAGERQPHRRSGAFVEHQSGSDDGCGAA